MTNKKDNLGDRMKMYESIADYRLMKRTPVVVRLDGKSFHQFTKGFKKPFDDILIRSMQETTKCLCENIQGCVFGYTQSDEITLILCDYQTYDTAAFFDYRIEKLCSVIASMCTLHFNINFRNNIRDYIGKSPNDLGLSIEEFVKAYNVHENALLKNPIFDCRCFNIPKEDVCNCIIWRQQDATRNSIQMVGQAYFSHKELIGETCNDIQDMLHEQKGINWNDYPTYQKRGTAVVKNEEGKWHIDKNMPIIAQDREYVEARINFDENGRELRAKSFNRGYERGYEDAMNDKEYCEFEN